MKVLIVNSDKEFIENFKYSFKNEDYQIYSANTIYEAINLMEDKKFELAIIDMEYKDGSGLDLKKKMNDIYDVPTIVVTKNNQKNNIVLALEYGCDDYIIEPFYLLELKARIRAVLRRVTKVIDENGEFQKDKDSINLLKRGIFEFNILARKVKVNKKELDLTGKEFELLFILVSNRRKIFTRKDLADKLWKGINDSNIRTVDVHIRRLREKMESCQADRYIQTRWGEGYYFDDGNN